MIIIHATDDYHPLVNAKETLTSYGINQRSLVYDGNLVDAIITCLIVPFNPHIPRRGKCRNVKQDFSRQLLLAVLAHPALTALGHPPCREERKRRVPQVLREAGCRKRPARRVALPSAILNPSLRSPATLAHPARRMDAREQPGAAK